MAAFLLRSACICFSLLAFDNFSLAAKANLSFSFSSAEIIINTVTVTILNICLETTFCGSIFTYCIVDKEFRHPISLNIFLKTQNKQKEISQQCKFEYFQFIICKTNIQLNKNITESVN